MKFETQIAPICIVPYFYLWRPQSLTHTVWNRYRLFILQRWRQFGLASLTQLHLIGTFVPLCNIDQEWGSEVQESEPNIWTTCHNNTRKCSKAWESMLNATANCIWFEVHMLGYKLHIWQRFLAIFRVWGPAGGGVQKFLLGKLAAVKKWPNSRAQFHQRST